MESRSNYPLGSRATVTSAMIVFVLVIGLVIRLLSSHTLIEDNIKLLRVTQYLLSQQDGLERKPFITTCNAFADENITPMTGRYQTGQACAGLSFSRAACLVGDRAQAEQWFSQARQNCSRQELLQAWGGHLAWVGGDRQAALDYWRSLPRSGAQYLAHLVDLIPAEDVAGRRYLLEEGLLPQSDELGPAQIQKYYALLAGIYRQEGDWPQIAGLYDEATVLAPGNAVLWIRLGQARRLNGELDEANKAYETALDLIDKKDAFLMGWNYEELSLLQQEQGSTSEAIHSLKKAIDWFEKSPWETPEHLTRLQARLQKLEANSTQGS